MKDQINIRTAFGVVIISLLAAFLTGALFLALGIDSESAQEPQQPFTFLSFIIGQSCMVIPLFWFLKLRNESIFINLRIRFIKLHSVLSTIYLSSGIIIISDALDRAIQKFIPAPDYIIDLNSLLRPESMLGFVFLFTAVAIIAPLGEELLFRGFFQQVLEKHWKDVTRAVLVTALFFSIIHMNPYWFVQIYILGVILGFLAWKTNSIIPSLILHSMNNATAILFSFVDMEENYFYLYNGYVAPWIIIPALYALYYGFKGFDQKSF